MKTSLPVIPPPHHELPPLYAAWMADCLGGPIPAETHATCHDCAMLPTPGEPAQSSVYFATETKCCTYTPELANFLVGRILRGTGAAGEAGRESVRKRIAARTSMNPLGLWQSASFRLVFRNTVSGFGHSRALRCPHYIEEGGGLCGVWDNRESVCSTWFCKHTRGPIGKEFWNRLQQMLTATEAALARHCAMSLDIDPEALAVLFPFTSPREHGEAINAHDLDGVADPERYSALWGAWRERESEYFVRCAELVDEMRWQDVAAACGSEVRVYETLVKRAHAQLVTQSLPERLVAGSFQITGMAASTWRVQTYSFLDPLDVPRPLMEALPLFDGRPTADAIRAMSEQVGEEVHPLAIQRLVDYRILVPAE